MRLLVVALAVVSVCLAGCKEEQQIPPGAKSTRTNPRMGASFEGNLLNTAGYQVVLPKNWAIADLTDEQIESSLKEAWKDKPELLKQLPAVLELAKQDQIKLIAFAEPEGPTTFVDNLNVLVEQLPREMTAKEVLDANVSQLAQMASGKPETEIVEVAGRPAGLIKWSASNGSTTLSYHTYVLVKGTDSTVFTFTAEAKRAETMGRFARWIMRGVKAQS